MIRAVQDSSLTLSNQYAQTILINTIARIKEKNREKNNRTCIS